MTTKVDLLSSTVILDPLGGDGRPELHFCEHFVDVAGLRIAGPSTSPLPESAPFLS